MVVGERVLGTLGSDDELCGPNVNDNYNVCVCGRHVPAVFSSRRLGRVGDRADPGPADRRAVVSSCWSYRSCRRRRKMDVGCRRRTPPNRAGCRLECTAAVAAGTWRIIVVVARCCSTVGCVRGSGAPTAGCS